MTAAADLPAKKGFTLVELLLAVGIAGILAAIILVAVDPARRLRQARNARRYAEANAVLNAILNYTVDNGGTLPPWIRSPEMAGLPFMIGSSSSAPATACPPSVTGASTAATGTVDVAGHDGFVGPYLSELPVDPRGMNDAGVAYGPDITGYYVIRSPNGRIEVGSCNPESEDGITVPQIKAKR